MLNYEKLSAELSAKIKHDREIGSLPCISFNEDNVIRQDKNKSSPIFTHHINYINKAHYKREMPYEQTEPNQIVVDYIASMTMIIL